MKIIVDSITLLSKTTGIGRYTYQICSKLSKEKELDITYFYGFFSKHLLKSSKNSASKSIKKLLVKNKIIKKLSRNAIDIFSGCGIKKYDLYWEPNFIPLRNIKAKKTVVTVHDFSFILYKEYHPKDRIEYFEKNFFTNIVKADMIITGSFFTKNEILERIKINKNKIQVIYHGVNHQIFKPMNDPKVDIKLPKKFILSVGSIEPRKNLLRLLQAYSSLPKYIKDEYSLVLVGFSGWKNSEILKEIKNNQEYIFYLGYLSDNNLAKVYNLATCFIYASLYEGFGLPPLEAMACGTATIVSNTSSIPEVCQDAALYFDPFDINDIASKIKLLLKDEKLFKQLIKKGFKRASEFTWEKSANEHKELFKNILRS